MMLAGSFLSLVLTFVALSFVWRDNPLYRTVENIFLGVALGLLTTFEIRQVLVPRIWDRLAAGPATGGAWVATIVIVLIAAVLAARAVEPLAWLGRVPVALAVGSFAGMAAAGFARVVLIPQVAATSASLTLTGPLLHERSVCIAETDAANALTTLACTFGGYVNAFIVTAGVVAGLVAFIFSRRENKGLRAIGRAGSLIIMVTLGVTLGYLVMTHFAVTIGRAETMIQTPALTGLALVFVTILVGLSARRHRAVTR